MTHTAHTPTKWGSYRRTIRTTEYEIAELPCTSAAYPDDAEQEANAAFIVLAVNNHAALLEALENLFAQAVESNQSSERSLINISTARAALTAAKGA